MFFFYSAPFLFFFKFLVSPDLFPSGFIHDLHLEIISAHENKPSAISGKSVRSSVCVELKRHVSKPPSSSPTTLAEMLLCGLIKKKGFDSNAKLVIKRWKLQLLGENDVSGRSMAKCLTLAQTKNMH